MEDNKFSYRHQFAVANQVIFYCYLTKSQYIFLSKKVILSQQLFIHLPCVCNVDDNTNTHRLFEWTSEMAVKSAPID